MVKGDYLISDALLSGTRCTDMMTDMHQWKNPFKGWINQPKKVQEEGKIITFKVPTGTDFTRKTRHSNCIMDNMPFHWHKVRGDFEVVVKITGGMKNEYDKAGIMVRLDEENWVYTGMECLPTPSGVPAVHATTCLTQDFSDWASTPLPEHAAQKGIWFAFKKTGKTYECFYSLLGRMWIQTRQGVFTERPVLKVGIVGACPVGDAFKANFEEYRVKNL